MVSAEVVNESLPSSYLDGMAGSFSPLLETGWTFSAALAVLMATVALIWSARMGPLPRVTALLRANA